MKRNVTTALFGALLAGSAMMSAGSAEAQVFAPTMMTQATVDLYGGFTMFSEDDKYTPFLVGGLARVNVPMQNWWNLQADVGFLSASYEGRSYSTGSAYLHFYKRDPSKYAFGAFVGYSSLGTTFWQAGVEGQHYMGPFTWTGQASIGLLGSGDYYYQAHAIQLRGQVLYDFTPNTSLAGDLMWTHLSGDNFDSTNIVTLAVTGMHRFASTPFGVFAQGRLDFINDDYDDGHVFTALGGVRFFIDGRNGTNVSNRRTGPAFDVLPFTTFGYSSPS